MLMMKTIEYSQIHETNNDGKYVLIDVRSPGEFRTSTIPGAVNIPLFNDEQRKTIGTVYVQESVEKAKKIGIEEVSKNLPDIYEKVSELQKKYNSLVFFCARGGMRSSSIVSLLTALGVKAYKLDGGYKGYRAYINKKLPEVMESIKFVVIHGNTGMGKTKILKELSEQGHDTLDLEGCANHRGSLLGSVGLGEQYSQKQFESLVYHSLRKRKGNLVFVEGESKRIGKIIMPDCIYGTMKAGKHIKVTGDIDFRVKNIMEDYIGNGNLELIEALNKLRKYISDKNIDKYISEIEAFNFKWVIEDLMIRYYDPMYENNKYDWDLILNIKSIEEACDGIIQWSKSLMKIDANEAAFTLE